MSNFKGKCSRCDKKCAMLNMYCVECEKFCTENVAWQQCKFINTNGLRCLREGHYHNGLCPSHCDAEQSVQPTLLESGQKFAPESVNPYPCDTN